MKDSFDIVCIDIILYRLFSLKEKIMSFKFTRFLSKLERDSRIILINRSNGKSIKMTAECYDILVDVVGPKMVKK